MVENEKVKIAENIYVRHITYEDTPTVVKWRNNPRVVNNFLYRGPFTEEIHNNWMKTKVESGEVIQFVIEVQEYGTIIPVGSIYYRDVDLNAGTAEYGIFIGEDDYIGRGIGSVVASWAVDYAREELNLKTLILRVLIDNLAAIRSYEKAGFIPTEVQKNYIDNRDLMLMKVDL